MSLHSHQPRSARSVGSIATLGQDISTHKPVLIAIERVFARPTLEA